MIASPVYFSNEKWQECLASHGLIVDKEARTLTVQSEKVAADMVYDLTKEETAVPVSYTHLDVYKRQARQPTFASEKPDGDGREETVESIPCLLYTSRCV